MLPESAHGLAGGWRPLEQDQGGRFLPPPLSSARAMPPMPLEPDPWAAPLEGRAVTLHEVPAGRRVQIVSLPSHPHLRERLKALGIRPGVVVQVVRRGRPGGILHLAHGPLEFMLRREHAAEIQVVADQE